MTEYGLVVPFVTVASKGGPHDDESYVAGFEMGAWNECLRMAKSLRATELSPPMPIHAANAPQLDRIAMSYGFLVETFETTQPEWVMVRVFDPETEDPTAG